MTTAEIETESVAVAREPSTTSQRGQVLSFVRRNGPVLTSEVSIHFKRPTKWSRRNLEWLLNNKFVGKQWAFQMGVGNFESTWIPEVTEHWQP